MIIFCFLFGIFEHIFLWWKNTSVRMGDKCIWLSVNLSIKILDFFWSIFCLLIFCFSSTTVGFLVSSKWSEFFGKWDFTWSQQVNRMWFNHFSRISFTDPSSCALWNLSCLMHHWFFYYCGAIYDHKMFLSDSWFLLRGMLLSFFTWRWEDIQCNKNAPSQLQIQSFHNYFVKLQIFWIFLCNPCYQFNFICISCKIFRKII